MSAFLGVLLLVGALNAQDKAMPDEAWAKPPVPGESELDRIYAAKRLYRECIVQEGNVAYSPSRKVWEILTLARVACGAERETIVRGYQAMQRSLGKDFNADELLRGLALDDREAAEIIDGVINSRRARSGG